MKSKSLFFTAGSGKTVGAARMNPLYLNDPELQILFSEDGKTILIPLINNFKQRVGYSMADLDDAPKLLIYSFSMQTYDSGIRYAVSSSGKKMHQLVMGDISESQVIDHCNNDSLNNRRSNLRVVTQCLNMQNTRRKTSKSSSQFVGVSKDNPGKGRTDYGHWRAGINVKGVAHNLGKFPTEEEAAKHYDVWAVHVHGIGAKTNNLLTDAEKHWIVSNGVPVGYEKPEKTSRMLPEGISKTRAGGFRFRRIRNGKEVSKTVSTLDEALAAKVYFEEIWRQEDEAVEVQRASNITRTVQGVAYVPVRYGEDWFQSLVDDQIWSEASKYAWSTGGGKYAKARIDGKCIALHRFVFLQLVGPIPKDMSVDHISSDAKLDNRLANLRLANKRLQGHNRSKWVNNLDRFKGVSFNGHTFTVIVEDKVYGHYETEEDAARVANQVYVQLYGQNALLNIIPEGRTTKDNRLPLHLVTREYVESVTQVKELKHLIRVLKLNEGDGGPYNLEKTKGKQLLTIRDEILSNKFKDRIGIVF